MLSNPIHTNYRPLIYYLYILYIIVIPLLHVFLTMGHSCKISVRFVFNLYANIMLNFDIDMILFKKTVTKNKIKHGILKKGVLKWLGYLIQKS